LEKLVYVVRHCSAEGQAAAACLTEDGVLQAAELVQFFEDLRIDQIISSPFARAQQSISPLAMNRGIAVEVDHRLAERVLSSKYKEDWLPKLEETFDKLDLKFEGGESSNEAMARVREVIDELEDGCHSVIVTHGNLMSLLLKSFDDGFGFKEWQELTNPDVYLVRIKDVGTTFERVWESKSAEEAK
jgi:2,3-bisphosphoglycerate-dependent phosphoglycerate mutase